MADKITLDRETFKVLASEKRLDILKRLDERQMTVSELSRATALNKATAFEHLNKLCVAGLVKKLEDDQHKWVYYKLTTKGAYILHPEKVQIALLLSAAAVYGIAGFWNLAHYFSPLAGAENPAAYYTNDKGTSNLIVAGNESEAIPGADGVLSDGARDAAQDAALTAAAGGDLPLYMALVVFLVAGLLVAVSVYLWRNRPETSALFEALDFGE